MVNDSIIRGIRERNRLRRESKLPQIDEDAAYWEEAYQAWSHAYEAKAAPLIQQFSSSYIRQQQITRNDPEWRPRGTNGYMEVAEHVRRRVEAHFRALGEFETPEYLEMYENLQRVRKAKDQDAQTAPVLYGSARRSA